MGNLELNVHQLKQQGMNKLKYVCTKSNIEKKLTKNLCFGKEH